MRKLRILLLWLGIIAYLVFAHGFVSGKMSKQVCERINIDVTDSLINRFVSPDDILNILLEDESRILGYPLSSINTLNLEMRLEDESFIKSADIYKTMNGVLNVRIQQRQPVIRIINRYGRSYYIDIEGYILPISDKFTSRILVANGHISEPFMEESTRSVFDVDPPEGRRNKVVYELYEIASFIAGSDLWETQIAQIYVNDKFEYEMIPRVGAHVIYFGDSYDYQNKFAKLEALYIYGLNNKGWNNYETINLKFENQIVCTKR